MEHTTKFGIQNPSWVYDADSGDAFDSLKTKAKWAENDGFVWFSVMDHLIPIPGVGAPNDDTRDIGPLPQPRASRQDLGSVWIKSARGG